MKIAHALLSTIYHAIIITIAIITFIYSTPSRMAAQHSHGIASHCHQPRPSVISTIHQLGKGISTALTSAVAGTVQCRAAAAIAECILKSELF